eukprot:s1015_g4.t1
MVAFVPDFEGPTSTFHQAELRDLVLKPLQWRWKPSHLKVVEDLITKHSANQYQAEVPPNGFGNGMLFLELGNPDGEPCLADVDASSSSERKPPQGLGGAALERFVAKEDNFGRF